MHESRSIERNIWRAQGRQPLGPSTNQAGKTNTMGEAVEHIPVLLLLAAFSRYPQALDWARQHAESAWGPIALESPRFDFVETDYYEPTMGPGFQKQFWVFEHFVPPTLLVDAKLQTGDWEAAYAKIGAHDEPRPLNLDPGYVTLAKLVLASTKDHAHRIYLERGIFAEVTLNYQHGRWQPRDWTFPDYRRADYHQFLVECRELVRQARSQEPRL